MPDSPLQVEVFSKGDLGQLLTYIDTESLPLDYGGTCACLGGCVPVHTKLEVELALKEARTIYNADIEGARIH
jgi:hypothetical protein